MTAIYQSLVALEKWKKNIFKYLYNYLEQHDILTKRQFGFRPKDSTVNQHLAVYHVIIEN